jgi:hypothetical protein
VSLKDQRDILRSINEELGKRQNIVKASIKEISKLETITRQLQSNEEDLIRLSDKQLENVKGKAEEAIRELGLKAQLLAKEKGIVNLSKTNLGFRHDLTESEKALLQAAKDKFSIEQQTVDLAQEEIDLRKRATKSTGLLGKALKVAEKAGVSTGSTLSEMQTTLENNERSYKQQLKEASKIDDVTKKTAAITKASLDYQANKSKTLVKGYASIAQNIGQSLLGIEGMVGAVIAAFFKFNNANRETRQLTGQTADNFTVVNDSILSAADNVETITALSRELGINVNAAFSRETIAEASEFTKLMGISEGATAKLALQAEATGHSLEDVKDSAFETVIGLAKSGKGAVNVQQVIEDTADVSGKLQATLGKNPKALARAAAEARALGLSLKEMESVADGLLEFESSIAAEMEAELLTGRQINLEQARQFALVNDMEGLTREIGKNQSIIQAFSSGSRIEQQAIEKSLGLSSDQIAKMIFQQQVQAGMSEEQAMKAAGINEEEMERLAMQEQFQKSLEKMAMALAPIVESFAAMMDNTSALKAILVGIVAMKFTGLVAQIGAMAAQMAVAGAISTAAANAITFGAAAIAIAAGIGIVMAATRKAKNQAKQGNMADGMIDSQGGLVVSGPKGSFSLDTNDTIVANRNGVIAGTNLGGGGGGNAAMVERMDRLIAATERGSTITMDGNLVGRSVADNTSALG